MKIAKLQVVDQINLKSIYRTETINLLKVEPVKQIVLKNIEVKNG